MGPLVGAAGPVCVRVTVIVVVQVTGGFIVLKAATVSQNGRGLGGCFMNLSPKWRVLLLAHIVEVCVMIFSSKQLKVVVPLHEVEVPVATGFPGYVGHAV